MNCPDCGRFMQLLPAFEVGLEPFSDGHWKWWYCTNDLWCLQSIIAAPEYDWEWFCDGIPAEALHESSDLLAEYNKMWDRLPQSYKRRYRHALAGRGRGQK